MTAPLTPDEIAAMQADALAGTPGEWQFVLSMMIGELGFARIAHVPNIGWLCGTGDHSSHEKDARRIARVPRLEATITAQSAEIERLREALGNLVDLNDNHSPFGGEIYRDRVDRAWDQARAALEAGR